MNLLSWDGPWYSAWLVAIVLIALVIVGCVVIRLVTGWVIPSWIFVVLYIICLFIVRGYGQIKRRALLLKRGSLLAEGESPELFAELCKLAKDDQGVKACLGVMFFEGKGVQKDYAQAMSWSLQAASSGNDSTRGFSMFIIGRLYEEGLGVQQNYSTAMEWYKKAASLGDSDAMLKVR